MDTFPDLGSLLLLVTGLFAGFAIFLAIFLVPYLLYRIRWSLDDLVNRVDDMSTALDEVRRLEFARRQEELRVRRTPSSDGAGFESSGPDGAVRIERPTPADGIQPTGDSTGENIS